MQGLFKSLLSLQQIDPIDFLLIKLLCLFIVFPTQIQLLHVFNW